MPQVRSHRKGESMSPPFKVGICLRMPPEQANVLYKILIAMRDESEIIYHGDESNEVYALIEKLEGIAKRLGR